MEKRELTCIGCPLGCPLVVTMENGAVLNVGVLSHGDGALVAPEYGVVPHADALSQRHIAHDTGTVTDQNIFVGNSQLICHMDYLSLFLMCGGAGARRSY